MIISEALKSDTIDAYHFFCVYDIGEVWSLLKKLTNHYGYDFNDVIVIMPLLTYVEPVEIWPRHLTQDQLNNFQRSLGDSQRIIKVPYPEQAWNDFKRFCLRKKLYQKSPYADTRGNFVYDPVDMEQTWDDLAKFVSESNYEMGDVMPIFQGAMTSITLIE